jgi:tRNA threonylcarbamoyladenosine biosynthesis protein TsaB
VILAIEASTRVSSVAVYGEQGLVAEYTLCLKETHSGRLLPSVHRIFKDSGMTLDDMDGVAVSIGPGSFTGIRVAVSTAKGLACPANKPVIPVSSLLGLAQRFATSHRLVCPLFDARKGEVYSALFRFKEGDAQVVSQETVVSPEKVCEQILEPTLFVGEGALIYKPFFQKHIPSLANFITGPLNHPSAATVGELGFQKLKNGQTVSPDALIPNYIRRSEAEINWEKSS